VAESASTPLYLDRVHARVRKQFGPSSAVQWTTMRGGVAGVELVVHDDRIAVDMAGGSGRAILGGPQPDMTPSECSMEVARIGWLGSPLFARDAIVITARRGGGRDAAIAVRPKDDDLRRLWRALREAGVIATSEAPA